MGSLNQDDIHLTVADPAPDREFLSRTLIANRRAQLSDGAITNFKRDLGRACGQLQALGRVCSRYCQHNLPTW
jgi:hypothetical protein